MRYEILSDPAIWGAALLVTFVCAVVLCGVALIEMQYPFLPKGEIVPDMVLGLLPVVLFLLVLFLGYNFYIAE